MAMQNLFNKAKSEGLKVAEYFTPTLKESKFAETGVVRYHVKIHVCGIHKSTGLLQCINNVSGIE